MKIRNMLQQPLELDFGEDVYRISATETGEIDDKYKDHSVLERNAENIQIFVEKDKPKEKAIEKKSDK